MMLSANQISKRIGGRQILKPCSLQIHPGRFSAVVGPNGAGKSTLLGILSGAARKYAGQVKLNGRPIKKYGIRELSFQRAVLPQQSRVNFPFTVEQIVEIGRYAHRARPEANKRIIDEVLELTGLSAMRKRLYATLSGGEQQRVQTARVASQIWDASEHPKYLLLDEPTASLDLAQQYALLHLIRQLCQRRIGVLAILHDLNLAARFADELLFLREGQTVAYGDCREVLQPDIIESTFGHPVKLIEDAEGPIIAPVATAPPETQSNNTYLNPIRHEQNNPRSQSFA